MGVKLLVFSAMAEIRGKRPMVISRSTFPGLGQYAGHWGGDVFSKWYDMRYSIQRELFVSNFDISVICLFVLYRNVEF